MRQWEIWKNPRRKELQPIAKVTAAASRDCTALHARKGTKAEADRVARIMRTQGTFAVVRKRGA